MANPSRADHMVSLCVVAVVWARARPQRSSLGDASQAVNIRKHLHPPGKPSSWKSMSWGRLFKTRSDTGALTSC
jgi:hypothetical protein